MYVRDLPIMPTPPPPAAVWVPMMLGVYGLMGTVFKTALDFQYNLPVALYGATIMGIVAMSLASWFLSAPSFPTNPGGPQPLALA